MPTIGQRLQPRPRLHHAETTSCSSWCDRLSWPWSQRSAASVAMT